MIYIINISYYALIKVKRHKPSNEECPCVENAENVRLFRKRSKSRASTSGRVVSQASTPSILQNETNPKCFMISSVQVNRDPVPFKIQKALENKEDLSATWSNLSRAEQGVKHEIRSIQRQMETTYHIESVIVPAVDS